MKRLILALLVLVFSACIANADVFDDNPGRYYAQGSNEDGNCGFIDKTSIRHEEGNLTKYIGIMRLSHTSNLFGKAKMLLTSVQVPQYVISYIALDCVGARLKIDKVVIVGVDTTDNPIEAKILWKDTTSGGEWGKIPNGIEPGAKALLCSPSF